jgi:hypothetical protein
MRIEVTREKSWEGPMKRNKRTEVVAHEKLTPLTDDILRKMGSEGTVIRHRLRRFYRERTVNQDGPYEPDGGTRS